MEEVKSNQINTVPHEPIPISYCRKIPFVPTKEQKEIFKHCFRATRYMWNKTLDFIEKNPTFPKSFIGLSKEVMVLNGNIPKKDSWLLNVPFNTRKNVVKQLVSNFKTNFKLLKQKQIKFFNIKFKSKKELNQVFFATKTSINISKRQIFVEKTTKNPFKVRRKLRHWFDTHSSEAEYIVKKENNRYYLCLPRTTIKTETRMKHYNRVALDPGVRTFQTFYSDQGIAGKIGCSITEEIEDLARKEDKLKSVLSKIKITSKTRYNIKKRCCKIRHKIKNKINDLHWKTATWLCSSFNTILLPSFETSNMVKRPQEKARTIRKRTVRSMLSLKHYEFKQRLLYISLKMGVEVKIVNEAYTTKTCGRCGRIQEMGGKKVFECQYCGLAIDRDLNGARNIFLKNY